MGLGRVAEQRGSFPECPVQACFREVNCAGLERVVVNAARAELENYKKIGK
jgi:hypothetical protein